MWACLWRHFSWLLICVRGPNPLWEVPTITGLLQEQQVVYTAKPFLHPSYLIFGNGMSCWTWSLPNRMTSWPASCGLLLLPPPQPWHYRHNPLCLAFYMGAENPISGCLFYTAITSPIEPYVIATCLFAIISHKHITKWAEHQWKFLKAMFIVLVVFLTAMMSEHKILFITF